MNIPQTTTPAMPKDWDSQSPLHPQLTSEGIARQLKALDNPGRVHLEKTLKDNFFTAITPEMFQVSTPQDPISPIKASPYSNSSGRTSSPSFLDSPLSTLQESPNSSIAPPRIPRPMSGATSSSSTDTTPIALLYLFLREERDSLSQSIEELTKQFSEAPENFVEIYKRAYDVQKLTSRTQSLKDKAQHLQNSNEKDIILQEYEQILSKLSFYAEKYNYRDLALYRVRNQLYARKSSSTDILLSPAIRKQGLEQKILLAETCLKISLLSEGEMDKSLISAQETSRFHEKKTQFLTVLKPDMFRLSRIIGTQALLDLTKNIQDPTKAKDAAHALIETLMLRRETFPALYRAAIAVASAADELQITQDESAAACTTIQQLLISIPYEDRQMLANQIIQTQAEQPVACITDLILDPKNISWEVMPFPLVWSVFSQCADREIASIQTHFDDYKT